MSRKQIAFYSYKAPRLSLLERTWLSFQLNFYWNLRSSLRRNFIILNMFLKRETRLYYLYTTKQLVEVTWRNYNALVKLDAGEYAMLLQRSTDGYNTTWMKAERF